MDQTLVTSGFDLELLVGPRYVQYILLSLSETGAFPLQVDAGGIGLTVYQPADVDRLYVSNPGTEPLTTQSESFAAELVFNGPAGSNVRIRLAVWSDDDFVDVHAGLGLQADARGNQQIVIDVRALQFSPGLEQAIAALQVDPATLLARVKAVADRSVPLPFAGQGQDLERIEFRQLPSMDGSPVALAFYLNLRLRSGPGPDALVPPRGDVFTGMNFLEGGQDIAFATRAGLLADLATNLYETFAEETSPGSGTYHHPMRERMFDPTSAQKGSFSSLTIRPNRDNQQALTGAIDISIRGEYTLDNFFDPDFTFTVTLTPVFDDGVVTWAHRTDLDSNLGQLLSFLVLGIVGLVIFQVATDSIGGSLIDEEQRDQMGLFLASLPVRVPIESLRWDPFYTTRHQIVARVDEWLVNDDGIAFVGRAALGKETEPVDHVVIRTETRDTQFKLVRLEYRVRDHASHAQWLDPARVFSATDRMDYAHDAADPALFGLSPDQVADRMPLQKILAPIEYLPRKVHLDDHKIFRMLCITPREVQEQGNAVLDAFRRTTRGQLLVAEGAALRTRATEELTAELGMAPTPAQVQARVDTLLNARIAVLEVAYRAAGYADDLERAVDATLLLDMSPNDYGLLQRRGILTVLGHDLIARENRRYQPGVVTLYYRDRADWNPRDNLLEMMRYSLDHTRP